MEELGEWMWRRLTAAAAVSVRTANISEIPAKGVRILRERHFGLSIQAKVFAVYMIAVLIKRV